MLANHSYDYLGKSKKEEEKVTKERTYSDLESANHFDFFRRKILLEVQCYLQIREYC